jgi:PAS domain S-box-containing protein
MMGALDEAGDQGGRVRPDRNAAVLGALCEGAMEGIVLHEDGVIIAANRAAESMFGYDPGEMTGLRMSSLSAPQSLEMVQRAVATLRSQKYDGYAQRKDGSCFRTEVLGHTVAFGEGSIRATVLRDRSERDEFERERLAHVSLLRATIESTADGLLVVDREGRLVVHNKRFWSMWSIPAEVMEHQRDDQILDCIARQLVHSEAFRSRLDTLNDSPKLESTDLLELRDGRTIERYSRPQYAGDEIIGRVWSFRDVTAQRRAEQGLELSVKMRDEFIGIASHELFTPIASLVVAIRGLHDLYAKAADADDPGTRLLRSAGRQINRLSRLVGELLDVTRIDAGRLALTLEEFDLCELVRETVDRFAPELERDKIAVRLSAPVPVVGRWDRSRLEQVTTNLLTNAIKFGRNEPVEINVRETPTGVMLEVVDHGIGIPADRQPSVFDRFQRAVSSRHFAGLGLGLFISRQIVEAHGGRLSLESKPGVGSVFRVELPRAAVRS